MKEVIIYHIIIGVFITMGLLIADDTKLKDISKNPLRTIFRISFAVSCWWVLLYKLIKEL